MARRKNPPDQVKVKGAVAERLRSLRDEIFGDRGGPELARRLGLPVRTWYNYESGVTVPAEVVLRFIELTSVEPIWLLHGTGPKFREPAADAFGPAPEPMDSIVTLLRTALLRLEQGEEPDPAAAAPDHTNGRADRPGRSSVAADGLVLLRVDVAGGEALIPADGPRFIAARPQWQADRHDHRCLRVADDAMEPLIDRGAYVTYSDRDADVRSLDGKLVVAWIAGEPPIVRWFQASTHYAFLRAENPAANPRMRIVDLNTRDPDRHFRVVSWISTPR